MPIDSVAFGSFAGLSPLAAITLSSETAAWHLMDENKTYSISDHQWMRWTGKIQSKRQIGEARPQPVPGVFV